jgi:hypothetical protein
LFMFRRCKSRSCCNCQCHPHDEDGRWCRSGIRPVAVGSQCASDRSTTAQLIADGLLSVGTVPRKPQLRRGDTRMQEHVR